MDGRLHRRRDYPSGLCDRPAHNKGSTTHLSRPARLAPGRRQRRGSEIHVRLPHCIATVIPLLASVRARKLRRLNGGVADQGRAEDETLTRDPLLTEIVVRDRRSVAKTPRIMSRARLQLWRNQVPHVNAEFLREVVKGRNRREDLAKLDGAYMGSRKIGSAELCLGDPLRRSERPDPVAKGGGEVAAGNARAMTAHDWLRASSFH